MMADDMGLGDTSAYQDFTGNSDEEQIRTPNMERLARMGVRFTDAHTPSSRCSPTRYALLTGRYPWRNRLKHWVLFGSQGDPMIEPDRPTLATLLKGHGYRTGMVGKWHVGLRYRRSDGDPAAGWQDADLTQPLIDTPLDHGFDYCRFTSRSHGTSGPHAHGRRNRNGATQSVGPGHVHGRIAVAASGEGKRLIEEGDDAYVLDRLGSRHSDHAIEFLSEHLAGESHAESPFFLYYPSNSNHGPYTPDSAIGGQQVAGAARNVAGEPMDVRSDFIYENDVALGRLLDFLETNEDPRRPGNQLIDNTIVIFTSDNGAERDDRVATGPFRSHKGSAYEGGHRVPFIVAWRAGDVVARKDGGGSEQQHGASSRALIGLQDLYATLAEIVGQPLPDYRKGQKGAEDSTSVLAAWRGERFEHGPMFYHDHKQAADHAASAVRLDDPVVDGRRWPGQWKLFFDASLLRAGKVKPIELFELSSDPGETTDRLDEPALASLISSLSETALMHRTAGGHRLVPLAGEQRIRFRWQRSDSENEASELGQPAADVDLSARFDDAAVDGVTVDWQHGSTSLEMRVWAVSAEQANFDVNPRGVGVDSGRFKQVDDGEAILIQFSQDVIVESVSIVAGNGTCGGFYRIGDDAPLAIYCIDADIDANDQSGILSDLGVLKRSERLRLDSSPHWGVEAEGRWRLGDITVRPLAPAGQ